MQLEHHSVTQMSCCKHATVLCRCSAYCSLACHTGTPWLADSYIIVQLTLLIASLAITLLSCIGIALVQGPVAWELECEVACPRQTNRS